MCMSFIHLYMYSIFFLVDNFLKKKIETPLISLFLFCFREQKCIRFDSILLSIRSNDGLVRNRLVFVTTNIERKELRNSLNFLLLLLIRFLLLLLLYHKVNYLSFTIDEEYCNLYYFYLRFDY